MTQFLFAAFVLGVLSQTCSAQEYTMCYDVNNSTAACMTVTVDIAKKEIEFHMEDSDDFEDVSTLEDYNTGFAASRVDSQEGCFVRRLVTTMEDQISFLEGIEQTTLTVSSDNMNVLAVSLDNPEEEIGQRLTEFCGDLPVYKLVKEEANEEDVSQRQVNVTFRRCVLFLFYAKCFCTTIAVPTGSTITYLWFFG